jgi:acyl-CoA synthetase (NDP forming)
LSEQVDLAFKSPLPILNAGSVALVGATERSRWGSVIYRNLVQFGYPGRCYLVNPRGGEVWGAKCYPDLAALPEPAEHALVIVPDGTDYTNPQIK